MNKYKKHFIFGFSIIGILLFTRFRWWFLAPLVDFKFWYPNLFYLLFPVKIVIGLLTFVGAIYFCFQIFKVLFNNRILFLNKFVNRAYIFILFLSLSIYFHSTPFSLYSMYNEFKDNVIVFYLTDEKENLIATKKISKIQSSVITKMYYSYITNNNLTLKEFGKNEKLRADFGKYLLDEILIQNLITELNINEVCLYQKIYFIQNDTLLFKKYKFHEKSF